MPVNLTEKQLDGFDAVLDALAESNADPSWPGSGDGSLTRAIARVREAAHGGHSERMVSA